MAVQLELSEGIQNVMDHSPVVLGSESIGGHFRNQPEIDDVKKVLDAHPDEEFVGLIGNRVKGIFRYNPVNLLERVRRAGLVMPESEHCRFLLHGIIPNGLKDPLSKIDELLSEHLTTSDVLAVDITALPELARRIISQPSLRTFASLYTSIDLAFLRKPTDNETPVTDSPLIPSRTLLGARSGSTIVIRHIYDGSAYSYGSSEHTDAQIMMNQFRPFRRLP